MFKINYSSANVSNRHSVHLSILERYFLFGWRTNFLWTKTLIDPLNRECNKSLEQNYFRLILRSDQMGGLKGKHWYYSKIDRRRARSPAVSGKRKMKWNIIVVYHYFLIYNIFALAAVIYHPTRSLFILGMISLSETVLEMRQTQTCGEHPNTRWFPDDDHSKTSQVNFWLFK